MMCRSFKCSMHWLHNFVVKGSFSDYLFYYYSVTSWVPNKNKCMLFCIYWIWLVINLLLTRSRVWRPEAQSNGLYSLDHYTLHFQSSCIELCYSVFCFSIVWFENGGSGMEWEERCYFPVRKLGKKGKAVPLSWEITKIQYQKKSGDRVHCTWYNPLNRLTWEITRSDKAKFRINSIVLQNMSSGKMH